MYINRVPSVPCLHLGEGGPHPGGIPCLKLPCTNQKRPGIRPWHSDACRERRDVRTSVRLPFVRGCIWDNPKFVNRGRVCSILAIHPSPSDPP